MVSMPGGMVTGYLVTAVFITTGTWWEISFYLEVGLLVPIFIYIAYLDPQYLSILKT